jgi:hypothetical protein
MTKKKLRHDTRRLVRLSEEQARGIDQLREHTETTSGVPVSFAAMVRVVVNEGIEQFEKNHKKK